MPSLIGCETPRSLGGLSEEWWWWVVRPTAAPGARQVTMTGHNPLTLNIAPYSKPSEADPKAWGDNGEWLRRLPPTPVTLDALVLRERARLGSGEAGPPGGTSAQSQARLAVSYTHLTLPTKRIV